MMRGHRRHRHFWHEWQDVEQDGEGDQAGMRFDSRRAWRRHFAEFLGVPPEKHWLFGGRRFRSWAMGSSGSPSLFNPFVAMVLSKGGGLLSLYVLHLLAEQPRHGNEIMREIEERTQGRWDSNPGAVYPLLTAMEERGFVQGHWEDPERRTRRTYHITSAGEQELERLKEVMRPKLEEAIETLRRLADDLAP